MKTYSILLAAVVSLTSLAVSKAVESEERFGGIGIVIAQLYEQEGTNHMGEIVVLQVPTESVAAKAGIQTGDVLVAVDGQPTKGSALADTVLRRLRGAVGSAIHLKVRRFGQDKELEFDMTRVEMKG
jgi:carboxyl-terminal processing protease